MPTYNPYTKTNDFPEKLDFYPIDPKTGRKKTPFQLSSIERFNIDKDYQNAIKEWIIKYNIPQSVIDEWNRNAIAQLSGDEQKKWWEKIADKVTNTVNNFVSQAGNVLQSAGESALLAPLLPFKKAMVNALRRKGEDVSMSSKLLDVASLFKQKVIDRSSKTTYEHAEGENITPQQILDLIDKIIPFFGRILDLVKSGKATAEEKLINADAEEEAKKATEGGAPTPTGVNAPTGDNWFAKYKFVIIGAVAVVLFLAFRKKK